MNLCVWLFTSRFCPSQKRGVRGANGSDGRGYGSGEEWGRAEHPLPLPPPLPAAFVLHLPPPTLSQLVQPVHFRLHAPLMNDSVGSKTEMSDFSTRPCNASGAFASADPLHCLEQISNLPENNGLGPSHHPNAGCATVFPTVGPNYGQYHQLACAYAASLQFGQFVANGNADPSTGCVKKSSGRQTYTPDQKRRLEEMFQSSAYVSKAQRQHLADVTKLSDKQIKIWFQNRRMKRKKQETGVGQQSHHQGDEGVSTSPSQQQSPADSSFVSVEANGVKSEPENGSGGGDQQSQHHHHLHATPLMFKTDPMGMKLDTDPHSSSAVHPLVQSVHGTCLPSSSSATPLTAMPFFNYYQYSGGNYAQHLSPYYPTATMFGMNTAAAQPPPTTATWPGMESGNGYISRGQL